MRFEDYQNLISELIDPDKQAEVIVKLSDAIKLDLSNLESLTSKTAEQDITINNLRDTNSKLALRVTTPVPDAVQPTEPETPGDVIETLKSKILKEEE